MMIDEVVPTTKKFSDSLSEQAIPNSSALSNRVSYTKSST